MLESVSDMGIVFNTEFNNKLNCRGDGKLYLLYEAASVIPDAVESQSSNGQILPARIIPLSETEFVVVLADFGVDQSLSFFSSLKKINITHWLYFMNLDRFATDGTFAVFNLTGFYYCKTIIACGN